MIELQKGEKVRVLKEFEDMDKIGDVGTIIDISLSDRKTVFVKFEDGDRWWYPMQGDFVTRTINPKSWAGNSMRFHFLNSDNK